MGQIITQFTYERRNLIETQFLLDKTLSKIEQYYTIYKRISDSFSIDDTQFKQIFGLYHAIFDLLDTRKNLLVDGLQLFSGMALFSKAVKFEDKIQFIFKLYDFNDLKSLSITDLEFMFLSACNVTYKLLGIKSAFHEELIIDFVHEEFQENRRINISEIKKWANKSENVKQFLVIINNFNISNQQVFAKEQKTFFSQKIYHINKKNNLQPQNLTEQQQMQKWLYKSKSIFEDKANLKADIQQVQLLTNCDVQLISNWVYGIRYKDVKYFVEFLSQNELVYFIGRIVVILNLKSNKQRHYKQHLLPIISIARSKELVATSEDASEPELDNFSEIRIWSWKDLKTVSVLKGFHKNGIHLLRFTNCGQFLISCGNMANSAVAIYQKNKNFELVYSTHCNYPTVQISLFYQIANKNCPNFIIASFYTLKCFEIEESSHEVTKIKEWEIKKQNSHEFNLSPDFLSPITCCAAIHVNKNMKKLSQYDTQTKKFIITGHEEGQIFVWSFDEKELLFQLGAQNCQITHILPNKNFIIVSTNSSFLNFWSIDLEEKHKIQKVDITTLEANLICFDIANIIVDYDNNYLICTVKGEFIRFRKQKKNDNRLKYRLLGSKYQGNQIKNIIHLESGITSHKLLETNDGESLLLYATNSGNIYAINLLSHTFLITWKIGEQIVSFDCYEPKEGGIQIIAATVQRKIFLNNNFSQLSYRYEMQKDIKCIKFCGENTNLLALGLDDTSLHFINISQNAINLKKLQKVSNQGKEQLNILKNLYDYASSLNIKKEPTKQKNQNSTSRFYLQNTVQNTIKKLKLSSNVVEMTVLDKKMILFITEDNKLYLMSLKDFYFKVIEENNPISSHLFRNPFIQTFYMLKRKKKNIKLPLIFGPHPKAIIACNTHGEIFVWKNQMQIINQNMTKYLWHSSLCSSLLQNKSQSKLYTCGKDDGMIIDSSLQYFYIANKNLVEPGKYISSSLTNYELSEQQKINKNFASDEILERQIMFSIFDNQITKQRYDQHLLVRGIEDETLRKLFKKMSADWNSINKDCDITKAPGLSLRLEYVFGIEAFNKRSTVIAVSDPLRLIYFVSNVIIVYNPPENNQSIYRGHRFRVSCVAKTVKSLIVSGEASYEPFINVWDYQTLETVRRIRTDHKWGIINICCENNLILSYGIGNKDQKIFTLQMHEVMSGRSIASQKTQQALYTMSINPLKNNEFVTAGEQYLTFWKIGKGNGKYFNGNMFKFSVVQTNYPITCCFYRINCLSINSTRQKIYEDELVIGNKHGQMGIVVAKSKLLILNQKAHHKQLNCIYFINYQNRENDEQNPENCGPESQKLNKHMTKNMKYILTSSEDETIKIWSRQFELLYDKDIRKIDFDDSSNFLGRSSNCLNGHSDKTMQKNLSAQSISAFILEDSKKKKTSNLNSVAGLFILYATRNGDIIIMKDQEQLTKLESSKHSKQKSRDQRKSSVSRSNRNSRTSIRKTKLKQNPSHTNKVSDYQTQSLIKSTLNLKKKLKARQSKIKKQDISFYLLLRNHSSQKSMSTSPEYSNEHAPKGKILFTHHPYYELLVTISEDQNLLLWDTERNILIMSRALSYMAEPTAIKFSKDGQILIIGHSDGSLLFLDSTISDSNQGKGGQKYVLPSLRILKKIKEEESCAILNIEISDSGDHLAVSYNNKMKKNEDSITEPSHISLFVNKSRQKNKNSIAHNRYQFNGLFQKFTTIPCQEVQSHYVTSQSNKYGMAAYGMSFTQSQGKTYLLFHEQLVDSNHRRLNCTKNGLYTLWDVNTSTVITNIDSSFSFNWKKIYIPNSIHSRYQLYGNLTKKQHRSIGCQELGISEEKQKQFLKNNLNINSNLLVPYMSTMANLSNFLIMGSTNGDIHLVQSSCLEFEQIFQRYPSKNQMFLGKTYPAHCSQVNHIQLNQNRDIVYTSSLNGKSVYKWVLQGDLGIEYPLYNHQYFSKDKIDEQTQKKDQFFIRQSSDIFNEVPTSDNLQKLLTLYENKHTLRTEKCLLNSFVNYKHDFKEYVRLISIIGRKAHDIRYNLMYDAQKQLVYSSGHAIVNVKLSTGMTRKAKCINFLSVNSQQQFEEQINLIQINKRKNIIYSCHKGIRASICIWEIFSKTKIKSIPLFNLRQILNFRVSSSSQIAIVYGLNLSHEAVLLMIELQSQTILGIINFLNQPAWQIKDMAFYPDKSSKFVTCGLQQTLHWQFIGNQLVYKKLSFPPQEKKHQSINICIGFTPQSSQLVTGCQDGSLVIWGSNSCIRKEHAQMIMVIKAADPNMLLAGTKDGYIMLWKEQNQGLIFLNKISIDRNLLLKEVQPATNKNLNYKKVQDMESKQDEKQQAKNRAEKIIIQSLDFYQIHNEAIDKKKETELQLPTTKSSSDNNNNYSDQKHRKWKVLIGSVNGDILEVNLEKKLENILQFENSPQLLFSFYDKQIPQAFFFSQDDSKIYEITNRGYMYCRRIHDLSLLFEHNFSQNTIDMLYSPRDETILMIFESEIKILGLTQNENYQETELKYYSSLNIKFITQAVLSSNNKMLAVCQKKNSDNSMIILVYDVSNKKQPKQLLHFLVGNNEPIEFMDFSKNNKMILVKMENGKIYVKDMFKPDNIIKEEVIQFIQWTDAAQKYFDLNHKILMKIENGYQDDKDDTELLLDQNQYPSIIKIEQIIDNIFLIGDIYGNIQIYNKSTKLIGRSKLQMTNCSMIRLSKSKKLLGVSSELNRNIAVFDISLCLQKLQ